MSKIQKDITDQEELLCSIKKAEKLKLLKEELGKFTIDEKREKNIMIK